MLGEVKCMSKPDFRDFVMIDEGHVVVLHIKRVTWRTRNFLGHESG